MAYTQSLPTSLQRNFSVYKRCVLIKTKKYLYWVNYFSNLDLKRDIHSQHGRIIENFMQIMQLKIDAPTYYEGLDNGAFYIRKP